MCAYVCKHVHVCAHVFDYLHVHPMHVCVCYVCEHMYMDANFRVSNTFRYLYYSTKLILVAVDKTQCKINIIFQVRKLLLYSQQDHHNQFL